MGLQLTNIMNETELTRSTIGAEVHSIFMDWLQVEDFEIRASIWPIGAS